MIRAMRAVRKILYWGLMAGLVGVVVFVSLTFAFVFGVKSEGLLGQVWIISFWTMLISGIFAFPWLVLSVRDRSSQRLAESPRAQRSRLHLMALDGGMVGLGERVKVMPNNMSFEYLRPISQRVLSLVETNSTSFWRELKWVDYHGFEKGRLPEALLQSVLNVYGVKPEEVQAEMVRVTGDLSHEVHEHLRAHAYVVILGPHHFAPTPRNAMAYNGTKWVDVSEGDVVDIPPGTPHGFTVIGEGVVYFLSIQCPPIMGDGHDDYHHVSAPKPNI